MLKYSTRVYNLVSPLDTGMPHQLREKLLSQGYHLLGEHGAFKACQWQRKSLLHGNACYKQRFYGIKSHRCLQMTPVVDKCTQTCDFCWRVTPADVSTQWNQVNVNHKDLLPAADLLDATIMANLRSLGGYNPEAGANVTRKMYHEAREPKHVAISLAGEPTLYPGLSELIEEVDDRGMTSFLVTNGTRPEVLEKITPPTQLYVTIAAPDKKTHAQLLHPIIPDAWEKLLQSQKLLKKINTRTVNRLTMVSHKNMHDVRSYGKILLLGEPDFVEVKAYMNLGSSRERLSSTNSPSHNDIRAFSEKLATLTGYHMADEQVESKVVLLSRRKRIKRLG